MKKTRWIDPYTKSASGADRATLKNGRIANGAGVYFVRSKKTGKIVYVGYSGSQLKKTIYRHFQVWNDKQFDRKVYGKYAYEIRFITCSPRQAERLEKYFVLKFKPRDNKEKYQQIMDEKEAKQVNKVAKDAAKAAWLNKADIIADEYLPF